MSEGFCAIFVRRPVATTLLTIGIALAGILAYGRLPVAPLPQVDLPIVSITANMPGASPDTMASSVASPLERHLGAIADVNEMTSSSSLGSTRITLQFGLDRNINGAARDVQAAINAARADLPASLRSNPNYRKINPSDAPVLVFAMTSPTRTPGQLYDLASNALQQRLSQIDGVGDVTIAGSSLPGVRVELNPDALFKYGIGLEDVRAALASANANSPKGAIEDDNFHYQIYANDRASHAAQFRDLVVAWRHGAAVRLADVGEVVDSVEDLRNAGLTDGQASVSLILTRQPGANIIETVDRARALLPQLIASLPADVDLTILIDRSNTIRASLRETERTLLWSVLLVMLVVFVFLGNARAAAIPSLAVPVSLVGSLAAMYMLGFSLNNLSLMALTISTGFVVDDAIVVLENISRHREMGLSRFRAAIIGAGEVSFTVISISLSLVAVFAPLLLIGGIIGRIFREFTLTLAVAVMISLIVSLTTTPMLCAWFLPRHSPKTAPGALGIFERAFAALLEFYRRSLGLALAHPLITALTLIATIGLNVYLFAFQMTYSLLPPQDTGLLVGNIQGDQTISFQAMQRKLTQLQAIVVADPAVAHVAGATGGRQVNSGQIFVALKPLAERKISADRVVERLRKSLAVVPGARLYLQEVSDVRSGGRASNAAYQYTLLGDDTAEINVWSAKLLAELQKSDVLTDVNSDQQQGGLESDLVIDRSTATRLGVSLAAIDNTLYDAFGQRQVSTIFEPLNQYHVVMEVAPRYWQDPSSLAKIYVSTSGANPSGAQRTNSGAGLFAGGDSAATASSVAGDAARNQANNAIAASGKSSASAGAAVSTSQERMIPLSAFAHFGKALTPLSVNHQGPFAAATLSFNLAPGRALSEAQSVFGAAVANIRMPATIQGGFAGTAATFQQSQSGQPLLFLLALATIYIVLGILYESAIHPITILSTLPSASVGAAIALKIFHTDFTLIAFIGVILLVGIVKKNAIMMVDFALQAQRAGLPTREAITQACLLRFRPIMMTTFAAIFGALPLAFGSGEGAELRQPLGLTIVGGLLASQALTLYTTPVIFLYLDRFARWLKSFRRAQRPARPAEGVAG